MIDFKNPRASLKTQNLAFKVMSAASALLGAGLLFPSSANAIQLTNARGFNAIIFGDLNASGGDTEGRLAVGGDMILPGSYSVGDCSSGSIICEYPGNSLPQSTDGSRIDLVVGGDIIGNASWGMNSGSASIGGNINGVSITTVPGSPNVIVDGLGANIPFDFATTEADLISDSAFLSTLPETAGTTVTNNWGELILQGTDPNVNVFNITAAEWTSSVWRRTIDVPEDSQVVINVSGETVNISGGDMVFAPLYCSGWQCPEVSEYSGRTLVNYYEATTINISGFEHEGSMLAPLAELIVSGGGINGQTVVASANTSNGFEFHYRDFGGDFLDDDLFPETPTDPDPDPDVVEVPEPGTMLGLLGLGVLGLGSIFRKAKHQSRV